jgi:pimeloyl-[acyl-carrier protein] methyl ester esterase
MDAPIQLVMLPGLDGTGLLFRHLIDELAPHIQPVVVSYPGDKKLGYDDLLDLVIEKIPHNTPYVILGESFSGPLALRMAARRPAGLQAVVLCASFISCPYSFVPRWANRIVPGLPFRAAPAFATINGMLGDYYSPYMRQAMSSVRPDVFAHRVKEVIQVDVARELEGCSYPILYIQAKWDMVVPGGNLTRILNIKPTVQHIQLASTHLVLQSLPKAAADSIGEFIADLRIP